MALVEYGSNNNPYAVVIDSAGLPWVTSAGGSGQGYFQKYDAALTSRTDYQAASAFAGDACFGACLLGTNLWFSDYGGNALWKVTDSTTGTPGTRTKYTTGFASKGPCGICTDGTWLYIACLTSSEILKVDPSTGTVSSTYTLTAGKGPFQICTTGGNLYFTCNTTHQIGKCTTGGASISYTNTATASSSPYGICVGPDGNLWYNANAVDKIGKISTDMTTVNTDYATGVTSSDARYICSDGVVLWFTDFGGNRVCTITTSGTVTQNTPDFADGPMMIAYSSGKVYWAGYSNAYAGSLTTPVALSKTTSDSWAWSDTATTGVLRSTSDSWAWSDAATKVHTQTFTTSDTWTWLDSNPIHVWRPGPAASAPTPGSRTTLVDDGDYNAFPAYVIAADGTHILVYTKGTSHANVDQQVVMRRAASGAALASASETVLAGTGSVTACTVPGAVLLSDNSIVVTYLELDFAGIQRCWSIRSTDHGVTWGSPKRIPTSGDYWTDVTNGNMAGAIASPAVEVPGTPGKLVVALHAVNAGQNPTYCYVHTSVSTDYGETWSLGATVFAYDGSTDGFEPYLLNVRLNNGTYKMTCLIRSDVYHGAAGYIIRKSDSYNGGTSWGVTTTVRSNLDAPTRPSAFQHPDGGVICAVRDPEVASPINAFASGFVYSTDFCDSFGATQTLDANGGELYSQWAAISRDTIGIIYALDMGVPTTPAPNVTNTDANLYYREVTFTPFTDRWAWSDSASGTISSYFARTTTNTWSWSDSAARSAQSFSRTTSDAWAWSDGSLGTPVVPTYISRTTSDTWAWSDSTVTGGASLFWFTRRRGMSTPTKTYVAVQPKGTTKTSTWTSQTFTAPTEAGVLVVLDVTSASGTGGLQLRINAHDQASAQPVPLNGNPTAVVATGTTSYALYPFGAVAGNVTQATSFYLPRMFSITVTHGDSSSYTYSVGYCLLP